MKRIPIRPVSKRRRQRDAVYADRRRQVHERARGFCEAAYHANDCSGLCEQVHHIAGRGGDDPHHLDNLVGLSRACHDYVHQNPEQATRLGLMRSRLADHEGEAFDGPGAA